MQIVISTMQCPCRTLNDECSVNGRECYEDDICSLCPLIMNGGVKLPKGHGRLIILSEDAVKREQVPLHFSCQNWISEVGLSNATVAILEADKAESEDRDG